MQRLIKRTIVFLGFAIVSCSSLNASVVQSKLDEVKEPVASLLLENNGSIKRAWDLSDKELMRLSLVREIAGPHVDLQMISPVELLGIYAQSDEERKEYARRYIQAQQLHRVRSMEWAITVAEIAASESSSYPSSSPMINEYSKHTDQGLDQSRHEFFKGGRYEASNPPAQYTTRFASAVQKNMARTISERAVVYIGFDCDSCDRVVAKELKRTRSNEIPGVDVVFSDVAGDAQKEISEWAVGIGITREEVGNRSVTLNYETTFWKKKRAGREVPLVITSGS